MRRSFVAAATWIVAVTLLAVLIGPPLLAEGETGLGKVDRNGLRGRAVPENLPAVTDRIVVPAGFGDVVLFATNSIKLDRDGEVSGDLVVNDTAQGATLGGAELVTDQGVTINGEATADRIVLGKSSTVGDVAFNSLVKGNGVTTGPETTPLSLPVFDEPPTFSFASPGSTDVTLPGTLPPGRYRDITVVGTLTLAGGDYDARSITVAAGGALEFDAPAQIRVSGRLSLGANSSVGSSAGVPAHDIVFFVGGENAGDGSPSASPAAASLGQSSSFAANLYAPNGTFLADKQSLLEGAFLARDIQLRRGTEVTLDTFFRNQPPVAEPGSANTAGSTITIELRGSDPEGGTLGFAIVGCATFPCTPPGTLGSLDNLAPIVPAPIPDPNDPPNTVQPPTVSATVDYTPPVGDPEDSFSFSVTDPEGQVGVGVVTINPFDPSGPPPQLDAVTASDLGIDTAVDTPVGIGLTAGAPDSVASLTFRIESLSGGSLEDSGGNDVTVPDDLPDPFVTFTPPSGVSGSFSFVFSARDSTTSAFPCAVPGCDEATVTITVDAASELAPDQTVGTSLNQPVQITLVGNANGAASGSSSIVRVAGRATTPVDAAVAGNVSDRPPYDGLGDGRNNLPGGAPVLVAAGVDVNLPASPSAVVDFESPPLGASDRLLADPYAASGVTFTVGSTSHIGGLVKNTGTSACVGDEAADDQNYGVGTTGGGESSIGFASSAITATFDSALPPGTEVSAAFQTLSGIPLRIRLYDGATEVASTTGTAGPDETVTCGFTVDPRAITTITASAPGASVTSAVLDLDTSTGGVVFVIDDLTVGDTSIAGTARIQVEWDLTGLGLTAPDDVEAAQVTLHTSKGTVDSLDTFFYSGTDDQDGLLLVSDYQAPASLLAGVVMPVTPGDSTFSFDATAALKGAVASGLSFFSIQGRVDEGLADGVADVPVLRGLQVRSTATGNQTAGTVPELLVTTPSFVQPLVWKVLALPTFGTLTTLAGATVNVNDTFASQPTLRYTPNLGVSGTDSVQYQVSRGSFFDIGNVFIVVDPNDECVLQGRPPGCSP